MGTLGDLSAWLENKKRVARRQLGDIFSSPDDFGRMQAARFREDQEKYMSDPAAGLDFVGGPLGALAGVVKPKGGNWLKGSVEKVLAPLKTLPSPPPGGSVVEVPSTNAAGATLLKYLDSAGDVYEAREFMLPQLQQARALDRWIEGPLTKYMKTQMATPEDPIRKLADQGILHYVPDAEPRYMYDVYAAREAAGFPLLQGNTRLGQQWEAYADQMVRGKKLKDPISSAGSLKMRDLVASEEGGEWAMKAPDDTMVYELRRPGTSSASVVREELGIDHLLDEMRNALDPNSGLPRELQLRPEQLQQMGMEKAVRHVDAINKWRAAAMEQAKLKELETAGMHGSLVREYAENNPMGLRWKELNRVDKLADDVAQSVRQTPDGGFVAVGADGQPIAQRLPDGTIGEPAVGKTPEEAYLAGQLITEGNIMGHCVGGYCPDVMGGKKRIFSLRDAKGEPHVTVEVKPQPAPDIYSLMDTGLITPEVYSEIVKKHGPGGVGWADKVTKDPLITDLVAQQPPKFDVVQIKGKQNLAPKDEYLPFVQDFVRNSPLGSWGSVGDIRNARLEKIGNQYMTKEEMLNIIDDINHPNWAEVNDALQRGIDDWEPY